MLFRWRRHVKKRRAVASSLATEFSELLKLGAGAVVDELSDEDIKKNDFAESVPRTIPRAMESFAKLVVQRYGAPWWYDEKLQCLHYADYIPLKLDQFAAIHAAAEAVVILDFHQTKKKEGLPADKALACWQHAARVVEKFWVDERSDLYAITTCERKQPANRGKSDPCGSGYL